MNGPKEIHNSFYRGVGQRVFNLVNPSVYTEFKKFEGETKEDWDITFWIYDTKKHGSKLNKKAYRARVNPSYIVNKGLRDIVLVPTIFLLSLIIASPISIKQKLINAGVGMLLFYLYISFYLSYKFEVAIHDQVFEPSSLWDYFVTVMGKNWIGEHILIVAMLIWAVLTFSPKLYSLLKE